MSQPTYKQGCSLGLRAIPYIFEGKVHENILCAPFNANQHNWDKNKLTPHEATTWQENWTGYTTLEYARVGPGYATL